MAKYTVSAAELSDEILSESDYVRSVLQNVQNVIKTRQGTVPFFREFGLPQEFVDQPMQIAAQTMLVEVREALMKFEPRAELVDVRFSANTDGRLLPVVEVEIINEQESTV